jgi:flagellin-like hook-associated protein FlgL
MNLGKEYAMAEVTLTAALRSNLLSLQNTQVLLNQTEQRLATGKKVNSALDNPSAFFASQSLTNRASDLSNLLDAQGQAVETLKATDSGITSITNFLQQAKAVAQQALNESNAAGGDAPTDAADLAKQFNDILAQITSLANDANYQGTNLLNNASNSLKVIYNEDGSSTQTIQGVDFSAGSTSGNTATTKGGGLGIQDAFGSSTGTATAGTQQDWTEDYTPATTGTAPTAATGAAVNIQKSLDQVDAALTKVRAQASTFGTNLSIIQTRQDFTTNLINTLKAGSDALTLADTNEEGANLLALQTAQQLGIQSLSLASQANQSVLRLFG